MSIAKLALFCDTVLESFFFFFPEFVSKDFKGFDVFLLQLRFLPFFVKVSSFMIGDKVDGFEAVLGGS